MLINRELKAMDISVDHLKDIAQDSITWREVMTKTTMNSEKALEDKQADENGWFLYQQSKCS